MSHIIGFLVTNRKLRDQTSQVIINYKDKIMGMALTPTSERVGPGHVVPYLTPADKVIGADGFNVYTQRRVDIPEHGKQGKGWVYVFMRWAQDCFSGGPKVIEQVTVDHNGSISYGSSGPPMGLFPYLRGAMDEWGSYLGANVWYDERHKPTARPKSERSSAPKTSAPAESDTPFRPPRRRSEGTLKPVFGFLLVSVAGMVFSLSHVANTQANSQPAPPIVSPTPTSTPNPNCQRPNEPRNLATIMAETTRTPVPGGYRRVVSLDGCLEIEKIK